MPNFDVFGAFYVPFIVIKFSNHNQYNFSKFIEKKDYRPKGWKKPIHTTFPNIPPDDTFISKEKNDQLKNDLIDDIKQVFSDLNMPNDIYFPNFWYNIYHDGQGQESHNHMSAVGERLAYWSGIYYYQNSTPTVFTRSDYLYKTQEFPGHEESHLNYCFYENFYPYVEDGDIVLFPPYLEHHVPDLQVDEKNKEQMRVTFAFNIGLKD